MMEFGAGRAIRTPTLGLEDRCATVKHYTSVVREEGVEPSRPYGRELLRLLRLPIPPPSPSTSV